MQYRNPFDEAPDIAVELNLCLWALAIGAIALKVSRQFEIGVIYYAIAPPLLVYGFYKLIVLFWEQEGRM